MSDCSAVSDLVELDRRGGLLDRDRGAVVELGRRRRARPSGRRRSCPRGRCAGGSWPSRRRARAGPCRRSASSGSRRSPPAFARSIAGDLADLDAGDPHRRAGPDVVRALERGLDLVVRLERDRLGRSRSSTADARSRRARRARSRDVGAREPHGCSDSGMSAYAPVSGSAVNVWPFGTRARPVNVGPCRPGERGSRAILYCFGKKRAWRSTKPRWPASQSARPSGSTAAPYGWSCAYCGVPCGHALAVGRLVGAHRAERVLLRRRSMLTQRALGRAGRVGLGEVLGEVGEEVVPAVADRHVRAVEAQLRVERGDRRGQAAQRGVGAGRLGDVA